MIRRSAAAALALSLLALPAALAEEPYRAVYRQGVELNKKGDYKGAIALYTRAIGMKKDDADLHYVRGRAYKDDGQYDRAVEDLTRAITLKPKYAEAYNHRGAIYIVLGKKDPGIADFRSACGLGNENGCRNLKVAEGKK